MLDSGYCGDRWVVKIMTCFYQLFYPNGLSMLRKNAVKILTCFYQLDAGQMLCKHVVTAFFYKRTLFFERGGKSLPRSLIRENSLFNTVLNFLALFDTEKLFLSYITRSLNFVPFVTLSSILTTNGVK